jgi:branched-chain amino acid aminotransferase
VTVWLDGSFVPPEAAQVSLLDEGVRYGLGLFETMRGARGQVPWLDRHLARLAASAERLGIPRPPTWAALPDALRAMARGPRDQRLRVTLTAASRLVATAEPLTVSTEPLRVELRPGHPGAHNPVAGMKTLAYLPYHLARMAARRAGYDEALLTDERGRVIEGCAHNLFVVTPEGQVITPPLSDGPLAGVARAWALERLPAMGLSGQERSVSPPDLSGAAEVFLTNAVVGVVSAVQVGGQPLPIGPVAQGLQAAHRALWESR